MYVRSHHNPSCEPAHREISEKKEEKRERKTTETPESAVRGTPPPPGL